MNLDPGLNGASDGLEKVTISEGSQAATIGTISSPIMEEVQPLLIFISEFLWVSFSFSYYG